MEKQWQKSLVGITELCAPICICPQELQEVKGKNHPHVEQKASNPKCVPVLSYLATAPSSLGTDKHIGIIQTLGYNKEAVGFMRQALFPRAGSVVAEENQVYFVPC